MTATGTSPRSSACPSSKWSQGGDVEEAAFTDCDTGMMVNSGMLDGLTVEEAKKKITDWLSGKR